jgi:ParB-like chromosome segregation protein Spo0J
VTPKLKIEKIEVGQRRRALNPDKVKQLAERMKAVGQITPIAVYTSG